MPLVERRYAGAFLDIALSKGDIDSFQSELDELTVFFNSQEEFRLFLLNPEVRTETKKAVVKKALSNSLKAETVNLIMLLLDKGRIGHLPGIYEEFVRLADKKKNILNMTIISASELDKTHIDKIKAKYAAHYNSSMVKAEVKVDRELIGGVRVVIGDRVIDDTLKGRLESLKEVLSR